MEFDAVAVPGVLPGARRARPLRSLVAAARPRQWVKNLLVVLAPAAAGVLGRDDIPGRLLAAAGAFCLVCSGTYLLNDVCDRHHDRWHPAKRHRPVASGALSPSVALVCGILAASLGLLLAGYVAPLLGLAALAYLGLSALYSLGLKRVPGVEMLVVAGCFELRAVAGGAAADVGISRWFLAVVSFAALFVVTVKRHAECVALAADRSTTRPVLRTYRAGALRSFALVCAAATAAGYAGWAVAHPGDVAGLPWLELSAVPVTAALLRYAQLMRRGQGEAPEELAFRDRTLQVLVVAWAVIFAVGLYGG